MNNREFNKLLDELSLKLDTEIIDNTEKKVDLDKGKANKFLISKLNHSVSYLNTKFGNEIVKLYLLPGEILEIVFNLNIKSSGHLLVFHKSKLVLVLMEDNSISFIGKILDSSLNNRMIKLLRLDFRIINEEIKIKDSSGLKIDIEVAITQILNWGLN